jgi:hypothetical protein
MDLRALRAHNRVDPDDLPPAKSDVLVVGEKVTSPELAELASLYLGMSDAKYTSLMNKDRHAFCVDMRRLAASVLSQAEKEKP